MSIKEYIGGQCGNPEGLGGIACAKFMNFFNAEHYRAVKKFVCKLDGARILDIGFGNGVTIKKLSKNINAKFYLSLYLMKSSIPIWWKKPSEKTVTE